MNRRKNRFNNEENRINIIVLASIVFIIVGAFILSYILYSNSLRKNTESDTGDGEQIASRNETTNSINLLSVYENSAEASSSMGRTVNELENNTKVAVNTSIVENTESNSIETATENVVQSEETTNEEEETSEDVKEEEETVEENPEEPAEEGTEENKVVSFTFPVNGEIIKDYAKENLIYSNTLEEWTTHLGIDFAAEKTEVVKASADGVIKSIKNDPRYGLTIVIEHANGFESIYSSLLSSEFVTVGEEVKQGQTIATVGNTATFEIADDTHLHFEIKENGKNVDPNIYLK